MSTEAEPYPTIPQRVVRGFLALVGACVLYWLSFGPVLVLGCVTRFFPAHTLDWFYAPLVFIAGKTSTDGPLFAYWEWWINLCEPKDGYIHNPRGYHFGRPYVPSDAP